MNRIIVNNRITVDGMFAGPNRSEERRVGKECRL